MSERITMPQLGETVTEGTILRWLVNVGDSIKEDDPILDYMDEDGLQNGVRMP